MDEQAKLHPEFKTLNKAFAVVMNHENILRNLEGSRGSIRGTGETRTVSDAALRRLAGTDIFKDFTKEEVKEVLNMGLRIRLAAGSSRGATKDPSKYDTLLRGLVQKKAADIKS